MEENEIKIGKQIWTTKNLDVDTYRNGDKIPQVEDPKEWTKTYTGAWCYYENKAENGIKYGKLYNWYAVTDPRGLAPEGYHIPTDEEWTKLTDNLTSFWYAPGEKMKSTSGWKNNGGGNNKSGFTGLPGGELSSCGSFLAIGVKGAWWSSSDSEGTGGHAWYRAMWAQFAGTVSREFISKHYGMSVRCIKD